MTTHNEHREELVELLEDAVYDIDPNDGDNLLARNPLVAADAILKAGWRKQGAAHPDTEKRAAAVLQEVIWPAIRDYPVAESWTYSEVANLVVTKAVDALAFSYLLAGQGAAHPDAARLKAEEFEHRVRAHPDWVDTPSRLRALGIACDVVEDFFAGQGAADDDTTRLRAELVDERAERDRTVAAIKTEQQRLEQRCRELYAERDALERKVADRDAVIDGQQEAGAALIRERDDLQARIDKALRLCTVYGYESGKGHKAVAAGSLAEEFRATLTQVSQPQPEPEHADDCQGCDGPNDVPCAADEVRGDVAYRNGEPIKRLKPEWDTYERVAHEVSRPQEGQG